MELPYIDVLLDNRGRDDQGSDAFSRHIHWGLWPRLRGTGIRGRNVVAAQERLDDTVAAGALISDGMTVLDVGCGFGGTLGRLSERLPTARLVGVNIDHRQLARALPTRARFICADGCALPLPSAAFDAVLAVECIFHFPSRLTFLQEARRVLKPGGRLSLSDFVPADNADTDNAASRWLENQVAKGYGRQSTWSDGDYQAMADKAGLVVEQDQDVTRLTLPTYLYLLSNGIARAVTGRGHVPIRSTFLLFLLSALGAVRYRLVVLRKPGDPPPGQDDGEAATPAEEAEQPHERGVVGKAPVFFAPRLRSS
ncbi:class I SAM-dependent methyltransferase [Frankia sp. CNm7]|uniref:Class I SAM-dependent methyltransferase n=2 Tax=Frankia nepalensis TaxID=1836974 RepID=A0A937RN42_9ACTN|nr:class I SAM-dependent methyltransferase [Frankia nepalensis]MBL7498098.1 class I SAM-dependent methyltransferase [Frankia nepalensis]MBL7509286.1 class I SAM-dependent methyltransferase [Frankia nepalensis]MBL7524483.1 class I SAM-dependent methyltransferase [Frankia nepalensis]MBL7633127.1 class I SAM-dependent methyltransferase [Frankia nepalensis]